MPAVMHDEPLKPILKKPPPHRHQTPSPAKPPPYRKPAFSPPQNKPRRRRYGRICCCCVCASLLILTLLIAVAGALLYLWFAPKPPVFRLRPVRFTRFTATAEPDGSSDIESRADIWLEVKNPNEKLAVYYGVTTATLTVGGDTELGSASVARFTQASRNVTVLRFPTHASNNLDLVTGQRLNSTVKRGAVKISVGVKTTVGIGVGKFRTWMVPVGVWCGGVSLKKLKDGGPPKCKFSWFNG